MSDVFIKNMTYPCQAGATIAFTSYGAYVLVPDPNTVVKSLKPAARVVYRVTRSVPSANGYDIYGVEVAL